MIKYELENFMEHVVCIQKNISSIVELVIIVFMWFVAVRNMSGEESCEEVSYGSREGLW